MTHDFSFTRSPIWLAGHLVALIAIVVFTSLGSWQMRRHTERNELEERIDQRLALPAAALAELLATSGDDLAAIELRRATVRGVYDASAEVILNGQSLNGVSGHNVLTPLRLDGGSAVVVNRGWVNIDATGPPVTAAPPPGGVVTVTGFVRLSQTRGSFGPVDAPTGTLDRIARVDVQRLEQQIDGELAPVWLQAASENPPSARELPLRLPPPGGTTPPPHLSYAVQWFVFAGVVAVGYPILLTRTARKSGTLRSAAA